MKRHTQAVLMVVIVILAAATAHAAQAPGRDESLARESQVAVLRAFAYLEGTQKENGSWQNFPAITALVVTAMLQSGEADHSAQSATVQKALDYIRSFAQENGAIYDRFYPSYSTSLCVVALVEAGQAQDAELIARAKSYLVEAQADTGEGLEAETVDYGGWGYEAAVAGRPGQRADLSNTQFALEALYSIECAAAGGAPPEVTDNELAYGRALEFLQRCQNLSTYNDQPWASDDGGFVYSPTESKAGATAVGGLRSYGGMTYAGLKSMIYARLDRDDARVQSAYAWVRRHWSVEENPSLGQQGLYYYYLTMARALDVYGEEVIVDEGGEPHQWRRELVGRLLELQREDGSWVNENGRWMEQMPDLVTAYAVLAIVQAAEGL